MYRAASVTTSTLPTSRWRLSDGTTCLRFWYSLERLNLTRRVVNLARRALLIWAFIWCWWCW